MFDELAIRSRILRIGLRDDVWDLLSPLDFTPPPSPPVLDLNAAFAENKSNTKAHGWRIHKHVWKFPHVTLSTGELVFTSVHLALRKR
jgi:hypothetical protein